VRPNGYTRLLFTLEPEEILRFQTTRLLLPPLSICSLPNRPTRLSALSFTRLQRAVFPSPPLPSPPHLRSLVYFPSFRFLGLGRQRRAEKMRARAVLFITIYSDSSFIVNRSRNARAHVKTRIDIRLVAAESAAGVSTCSATTLRLVPPAGPPLLLFPFIARAL